MLQYIVYGTVILTLCLTTQSADEGFTADCDDFDKESDSYYKCLMETNQEFSPDESNRSLAERIADFIRLVVRVTRPFSDIVLDAIYTVWLGRTRELPPIDNKILLISATELAEKIRKREISSEEVVQAYIDRVKAVNPIINAAVDQRFEDALNEARQVDSFLASENKTGEEIAKDTPLLGLPFSCKEGIGVKGLSETWGLVRVENYKAAYDADVTSLYRKAGAIPIVVTNVPELLMYWESANHVFGMTQNPYDNRRTVGGSSGGEASLIASAGSLFGLGNDIAGSIRIPSSFNGIYGHKPSRGLVSNNQDQPLEPLPATVQIDQFISTGPMCRYVNDLLPLFKVLVDNDERVDLDQKVDFTKLTIYYMEELPGYLTAAVPIVKDAIKKAVQHFEDMYGVKAIKLEIEELYYAHYIWEYKLLEYGNPPIGYGLTGGKPINYYVEFVKNIFGQSDHTMPSIYQGMTEKREKDAFYYKCLRKYEKIEQKFNETLQGKNAILLVPTHPEPPPHYLMTIPKYPNIGYTNIFNILGFCSTNIPAGLSERGLPFGIQAVSGRYHDRLSIATAVELDKVFKGWNSPCPITV